MSDTAKDISLETIISTSIKLPGVKVNRNAFLTSCFPESGEKIHDILELGPIEAGYSEEQITKVAKKLIVKRTSESSIASFIAGIPGGLAMAATIPLDIVQFFGMALRLAQEVSYLYGADDLWENGNIDDERVKNQLILYCGVMFGVSSAVSGVRVLTTQIAKTTLKKLPQKALTKTFWYPIVKSIGKAIGVKVTKSTVASGVSKAIPVVGGVISGGLNFASMLPMGNRLQQTLSKACFDYSEDELAQDIEYIEHISDEDSQQSDTISETNAPQENRPKYTLKNSMDSAREGLANAIGKVKLGKQKKNSYEEQIASIRQFKELLDEGIITQEEFDIKKEEILSSKD